MLSVRPGDTLRFSGCTWHDGWDFDAPLVIYAPVQMYSTTGSVTKGAIEAAVEDLAIDLCLGEVRQEFHADDLKEFAWRGWSPAGFKRRRSALHAHFDVTFRGDEGDMEFDMVEVAQ